MLRRVRRGGYLVWMCLGGALLAPGWLLTAGPAIADVPGAALVASIDGQRLSETTRAKPIVLEPQRRSELAFELRNEGTEPLLVHQVLLVGRVMAIRFFTYTYTLPAVVQAGPGETVNAIVPLDLPGLRSQVVGLLPGEVTLFAPDGRTVISEDFVLDARGSLQSVYGLLGGFIGASSVFSFLTSAAAMARRRLSPHRWNRAFRFLLVGIGLGLSLVFGFSIVRAFVPQPDSCARVVLICAGILFVIGCLTPGPPADAAEVAPKAGGDPPVARP